MRILRHYTQCPEYAKHTAVALGNFDGVHRGHQAVITQTVAVARKQGVPSAIMTFEPHPREVLFPDTSPFRIFSFRQKIEKIRTLGIDFIFAIHFTPAFSKLSGEDFITQVLVKGLDVSHVVIGHDFIFGHQRSGNALLLETFSQKGFFSLTHIKPVSMNNTAYSSTQIRERLQQADITGANALLGHAYEIEGRVIKGKNRGKNIGFPTANIRLKHYLPPAYGIYIAEVLVDKQWHPAAVSIGVNPTFGDTMPVLEVHLLDYTHDLYGRRITVRIHQYLRPEQKFDTIEALKKQIARDCEIAREYFKGK